MRSEPVRFTLPRRSLNLARDIAIAQRRAIEVDQTWLDGYFNSFVKVNVTLVKKCEEEGISPLGHFEAQTRPGFDKFQRELAGAVDTTHRGGWENENGYGLNRLQADLVFKLAKGLMEAIAEQQKTLHRDLDTASDKRRRLLVMRTLDNLKQY